MGAIGVWGCGSGRSGGSGEVSKRCGCGVGAVKVSH
jgi:hypothetical protein